MWRRRRTRRLGSTNQRRLCFTILHISLSPSVFSKSSWSCRCESFLYSPTASHAGPTSSCTPPLLHGSLRGYFPALVVCSLTGRPRRDARQRRLGCRPSVLRDAGSRGGRCDGEQSLRPLKQTKKQNKTTKNRNEFMFYPKLFKLLKVLTFEVTALG